MAKGIITKDGEYRTGIPAGTKVRYSKPLEGMKTARNVYVDGVRRAGIVSFTGKDRGIRKFKWKDEKVAE